MAARLKVTHSDSQSAFPPTRAGQRGSNVAGQRCLVLPVRSGRPRHSTRERRRRAAWTLAVFCMLPKDTAACKRAYFYYQNRVQSACYPTLEHFTLTWQAVKIGFARASSRNNGSISFQCHPLMTCRIITQRNSAVSYRGLHLLACHYIRTSLQFVKHKCFFFKQFRTAT